MVQPFFSGMIYMMLAKFMLNDLPHAAGLSCSVVPAGNVKCSPELMPSWPLAQRTVKEMPEYEPCLGRATVYLVLYSRFANEEYPSDELVGETYSMAKEHIARAVAVNWGEHFGYPEGGIEEFFREPLAYIDAQPKPPYPPHWRSGEAVWHYKFHLKLVDLLKPVWSRLDKVEVIEKFTGLMHHNWTVLSYAFAEYTEKPYIRRVGGSVKVARSSITPGTISRVVKEVLDCLAR